MKQLAFFSLVLLTFPLKGISQNKNVNDTIVQLYGVVMTADSLRGIPAVAITIRDQNRGTLSNDQGVFSIVVNKGDIIDFSTVGFKSKSIPIPKNLEGNRYSVIQLLVTDTVYLPATIIRTILRLPGRTPSPLSPAFSFSQPPATEVKSPILLCAIMHVRPIIQVS